MSIYLHDIPLSEALARLESTLMDAGLGGLLGVEEILLDEAALSRVLAEPVWARLSSPHYNASAMDGFAVRAKETVGAMPNHPVTLSFGTQAAYVDTGDLLPGWADAVIPIEKVEPVDEQANPSRDPRHPVNLRIRSAVTPWSNVRSMGEDMVATQLVLPAGQVLRPVDIGAIAASGHSKVKTAIKPRVAILPTGTELVPVGQDVKPGDIIEYNSLVLAAQVNSWGGDAVRYPITPDNFEQISDQVKRAALEADLILLNAGSSAGSEDFSARVVESLGKLLVHGVAVRPGHPVIIGMISLPVTSPGKKEMRLVPVIGVPGYPVSAALTGEIFVRPLITRWLGRTPEHPQIVEAVMTRKITSPPGDDDYVRVALGKVKGKLLAAPLSRGAGVISSLVRADGIALLPRGSQGVSAGERVRTRLLRSIEEIEQTILVIGSHDISLDLLAQFLAQRGRRLSSANVGSQGGLVALRREEAHLAGSHLLDPASGEYNVPYLSEYIPGIPVRLVTLVGREQGLIVKKGNPKGIRSLADLAREDIRFVNRQRGAGTRVLLDYQLDLIGVKPESISGYGEEEYTHLGVAAAVLSGKADCGMGIAAAAQALDLDFISLFQERYDLVVPLSSLEGDLLEPLFDCLKDEEFRRAVGSMPGYDVTAMGTIAAEVRN